MQSLKYKSQKLTFNLPNFNYKSVWQDPNRTSQSTRGELPNITGVAQGHTSYAGAGAANGSGAILETRTAAAQTFWAGVDNASTYSLDFNASRSSTIYRDGQTQVVPAAVCILFCIKY